MRMTLAEKLRFLSERADDGKEFYCGDETMRFNSKSTLLRKLYGEWFCSDMKVNTIDRRDLKIKPKWEFTEDEKAILRNLPEKYKWIIRTEMAGTIIVSEHKPYRGTEFYDWRNKGDSTVIPFKHIFQCIQWSNDEPCEFRRYL